MKPARRRPRLATGGVAAALLGLLLLVPSANVHVFDGLPASSLPEAVALALLVPLAASRGLRRRLGRLLRRLPRAGRAGLLAAAALGLLAKAVLLASGAHAGFLACYRPLLRPLPGGVCERSYENTFRRFGVTRLDRRLDFGPDDWQLGFWNSVRFNIYPWVAGNPIRGRLPFAVTWRGVVERREPWLARVTYTGTATIQVGERPPVLLAARYGAPRVVSVPVPAGRQVLVVTYAFDDGSRVGSVPPKGPYGTFRLRRIRVADEAGPEAAVATVRAATAWRALGAGVDAVGLALGLGLLGWYAWLLRREWWVLALAAAGGPAAYATRLPGAGSTAGFLLVTLVLFLALLARPRGRRLLASYASLLWTAAWMARRSFSHLAVVRLRTAGDDPLTYESYARAILETGSLEAGEPVFYYQPLFRYLRFGERLLLGEADPLVFVALVAALHWALFWLAARTWPPRRAGTWPRLTVAAAGFCLLGLAGSTPVVGAIHGGLSEGHTWIFLPLLLPSLLVARQPRAWLPGTALVGLSVLTRTNQAPGALALFAVFLARAWPGRPRAAAAAVGLLLALFALPAVHNAYYGGRLTPLPVSAGIPQNLELPPGRALAAAVDPQVRAKLADHLRAILYFPPEPHRVDPQLAVAIRGIQALWLAAAIAATFGAWSGVPRSGFLLAVPLCYLGVHLFYQVWVYYPRHVVIGYLAAGAVVMAAAGGAARLSAPGRGS